MIGRQSHRRGAKGGDGMAKGTSMRKEKKKPKQKKK
jgi:hypothetical protein